MSRKRIIVEELDDGSFTGVEQDVGKAQQSPNGQMVMPTRDTARESKKGIMEWVADAVGYREGKE